MRDDLGKAEQAWRKRQMFRKRRVWARPMTLLLLLLLGAAAYGYHYYSKQPQVLLDNVELLYGILERSIRR